jgi:hypothetical protein
MPDFRVIIRKDVTLRIAIDQMTPIAAAGFTACAIDAWLWRIEPATCYRGLFA